MKSVGEMPSRLCAWVVATVASAAVAAPLGVTDEFCGWENSIGQPGMEGVTQPTPPPGVMALTVYDGDLIAAGHFTNAGGIAADHIARWDGSQWHPLGDGLGWWTMSLTTYDNLLIAGGFFTPDSGAPSHFIAAWDGSSWQSLGSLDPSLSSAPIALATYDGDLIAGGSIPTLWTGPGEGIAVPGIVRWDGSAWHPLGPSPGDVGFLLTEALVVYNDDLIIGGTFTIGDPLQLNNIARWDGTTFSALGSGFDGSVRALAVFKGDLIAAGNFVMSGGAVTNHIARWDGTTWNPLGSGTNGEVVALTVYHGDLIAAGWFSSAGGNAANHIARWDGKAWHPLDGGTSDAVVAMASYNSGLICGGWFNFADGLSANAIAMWGLIDTDGDGIPDCWEIHGIPYVDAEGREQRYELPKADPLRKNLWIEVDSMSGVALSDVAKELLETAFELSPVSNPDGSFGITLHIQRDESDLAHVEHWETDGCWPEDFYNVRDAHFGNKDEHGDEGLLAAKAKAFRYAIVADKAAERGTPIGLGGCAGVSRRQLRRLLRREHVQSPRSRCCR